MRLARLLLVLLTACSAQPGPDVGDVPDGGAAPDATPEGPSPFAEVCTPAVDFVNLTAAGNGAIFDDAVPDAVGYVQAVALRICEILYRRADEVPSRPAVKLVIEDMDGVAYAAGDEVHVSSRYLRDYADGGGDVASEIAGVLHHEYTHVYQYNDGPGGVIEGFADYVRYHAGYVPLSSRQPGGTWDAGYRTTAFFFLYVEEHYPPEFGYHLNLTLDPTDASPWSTQAFVDLTGKDVDTLWAEYQATLN